MITLRTITEDNFDECLALHPSVSNEHFVDPVAYSLAEAWMNYLETKPFAIYAEEQMIGYVSLYVGNEHYQIINFFIDEAFQEQGYGKAAAKKCIAYLVDEFGATRISLPVDPANHIAIQMWSRVGFILTEDKENGYQYMRMTIDSTEGGDQ